MKLLSLNTSIFHVFWHVSEAVCWPRSHHQCILKCAIFQGRSSNVCKGARKPCIFPMLAKFCTILSTAMLFNFLFKRIFVNKIQTMLDCLVFSSKMLPFCQRFWLLQELCLHALMTSSYTSKTHLSHPNYKWGFDLPIFSKLPSKFGVAW